MAVYIERESVVRLAGPMTVYIYIHRERESVVRLAGLMTED